MKLKFLMLSCFILITSCNQDKPVTVKPVEGHGDEEIGFTLKIENISKEDTIKLVNKKEKISLLSGAWSVYEKENPFYKLGNKISTDGFESIIEDGDTSKFLPILAKKDGVKLAERFDSINIGESKEIKFKAKYGTKFSFVTMLNQSNDAFYSTEIELFDPKDKEPVKGDFTTSVKLYDAGSEVNQKLGEGDAQPPRQKTVNFGNTENEVVKLISDVKDGFEYPKTEEVLKITLTNDDVHDKK